MENIRHCKWKPESWEAILRMEEQWLSAMTVGGLLNDVWKDTVWVDAVVLLLLDTFCC